MFANLLIYILYGVTVPASVVTYRIAQRTYEPDARKRWEIATGVLQVLFFAVTSYFAIPMLYDIFMSR